MWNWTWKSLITQPASLLGSAGGIACAFLLVIFFDAVWRGESEQIVVYIEEMQADVWVMQRGVHNMHMATSFIWDWKADRIADMPGVEHVTPILYLNTAINAGEMSSFNYVVGLIPGDPRAGPWDMAAGRTVENVGEAVIPDVLSRLSGIDIGDEITITDDRFRVVGLSRGTYSAGNPITFVTLSDLEDILSSAGSYSYLLVDAEEGVDPDALVTQIMNEIDKVNAMTHAEFIRSDFGMAVQMGVEIIFMMTLLCSCLAALIVAFTSYSLVTRRRRELAIAKALGTRNRTIIGGVVAQAAAVTAFGFATAGLVALVVLPWLPVLLPQLTLAVSFLSVARIGFVALLVGLIGAAIPAYKVSKLDPASAFHV